MVRSLTPGGPLQDVRCTSGTAAAANGAVEQVAWVRISRPHSRLPALLHKPPRVPPPVGAAAAANTATRQSTRVRISPPYSRLPALLHKPPRVPPPCRSCGSCEHGDPAIDAGADFTAVFAPAGAPTQTATLPTHVGATEGANGGGQADREERRLRLQAGRRDAPPFASCSGCCAWASGSARAGRRSGRSQRRQGLPIRRSARPAPRRASCGHRRRACGCFPCRTAGCPHPRSRKPCCAS